MRLLAAHRRRLRAATRAPGTPSASGFTLAEIAVTLIIVAMTLLLVMDGLNSSKITAANSSNRKIALDLALLMIGRVESGVFWDELDGLQGSVQGTFAEEGYEAFEWELAVGEDELSDYDDDEGAYFDNFRYDRYRERELREDDAGDDEAYAETGSTGGPYEIVKVRVVFPKLGDQSNEVVLERWVPLEQVFGRDQDTYDFNDGEDES